MNLKKIGKGFLLSVFFLFFGFSTISWASGSGFDFGTPDFITDIEEDVFAQTSEVTIKLEKRVPRSPDSSSSIETAQGIVKSSQDPEDYEDLEDPFAGDTATASSIVIENEATEAALTLRNYKLAATFSGDFKIQIPYWKDSLKDCIEKIIN